MRVRRKNEVWGESGYSDVNVHRAHCQLVSNLYSISNYMFLDADECKASLPVFNTNAICQNTPDSYIFVLVNLELLQMGELALVRGFTDRFFLKFEININVNHRPGRL